MTEAFDEAGEGDPSASEFAARLQALVDYVPRRDGQGAYTDERLAEEISAYGVEITKNYLWMLRTGRRTNPAAKLVWALSRVFGVSMEFFFDPDVAERTLARLEVLAELAHSRDLIRSRYGVTDQDLADFEATVQRIRSIGA